MVRVEAISPERDDAEIRFPRVEGYRTELPRDVLTAEFNEESTLELTPDLVGATRTTNAGIIGEEADFNLDHLSAKRNTEIAFKLANRIVQRHFTEDGEIANPALVMEMRKIVRRWMSDHLVLKGDTQLAQLLYHDIADRVAERIKRAIHRGEEGGNRVIAMLDPYNREVSTHHVGFNTSQDRYDTGPKCHVNYAIADSDWELEFCRVADANPRVLAWVKNHNLGFEVPYRAGGEARRYRPDFILKIDDGHGPDDPLHVVVEIKGFRNEDAKDKADTMATYWVPGVNNLGTMGRWAFAEFTDKWTMQSEFEGVINEWIDRV